MNPYNHHTILQQQHYVYGFPMHPIPLRWGVHDQYHHMIPVPFPMGFPRSTDAAILANMLVNQQPMLHPFEAFLEERLMTHESETNRAQPRQTASPGGSGLSEEKISEHLHVVAICEGEEVDVCSICLGEYEKNEKMGRLECGHRYHPDCIKRWLLSKNVCPMCRSTALTV
jgi:hypothetical protein